VRRPEAVDLMLLSTVLIWAMGVTVTRYALTHGWQPLAFSAVGWESDAISRSWRLRRRSACG
jgi:hypothetical protein